MKRISTFLFICFIMSPGLFAQENSEPSVSRIIENESINGLTIEYQISNFETIKDTTNKTIFDKLHIKDFSHLHKTGKPSLPANNDMFLIPEGSTAKIKIISIRADTLDDFLIMPAHPPRPDEKVNNREFRMDTSFYQKDTFYPSKVVALHQQQMIRNMRIGRVKVTPFRYDPAKKQLIVIREIRYKIDFNASSGYFKDISKHSDHYLNTLPNKFLNDRSISKEIKQHKTKNSTSDPDYLIISHSNFHLASDTLALWKEQLGYDVKIIERSNWTTQQITDSVAHYYNNSTPHPDYFVILGDHQFVPAKEYSAGSNRYTDLYYACMDSVNDFYPDMAHGRIAVSSPGEALTVVNKIIDYEKNLPQDTSFFNNGLNCAYFQDNDTSGYANRRFVHTSEEVRNYLLTQNYNVERVYYAHSWITPTHFNAGYYSNGQPLPPSLLKSNGFNWDGDGQDVTQAINSGKFYVLHRDHGYSGGWGDPDFSTSNIPNLQNTDNLPVVFSMNCSSGRFTKNISFAEKLLRKPDGGASGVIAASSTSYSGYNDALSVGFVDAIWANPGLVPNFGSGGIQNPSISPHSNIRTMGDVLNHGLMRMSQTWGKSRTTYELFHYHGDPAMRIRTQPPQIITASHQDTLHCDSTSFQIHNSNVNNATAVLTSNGNALDKAQLNNGSATFTFSPITNKQPYATLTISSESYKPYVKKIPITGCTNQPVANFYTEDTMLSCFSNQTRLHDISFYNPSSRKWNVQPGSISYLQGTDSLSPKPVIQFNDTGYYDIELIVQNAFGPDTILKSHNIQVYPAKQAPYLENLEQLSISAIPVDSSWNTFSNSSYAWNLHQDSTPSFYTGPIVDHTLGTSQGTFIYTESSNGNSGDTAIFESPVLNLKNLSIPTLKFWYHMHGTQINKLHIEASIGNGWQTLHTLNNQQQTDYDDAWKKQLVDLSSFKQKCVKLRFRAIRGNGYRGDIALDDIEIFDFNNKPTIKFSSSIAHICRGHKVKFLDKSCCGTTSRAWTFPGGQPSTSTKKEPVVQYDTAGKYNVSLKVQNSNGADSLTKYYPINVRTNQQLPGSEDFETFYPGNPGTFYNDWEAEKTNKFEWQVNTGSTNSSGTGPVKDHTKGTSNGVYVYTEASYVSGGEKAYLFSPCYKLPDSQRVYLSLWVHMYGNGIDTIHFDVYDGQNWHKDHFFIAGEQQTSHTDAWKKFVVNLSAFTGKDVLIRFRSIRRGGYKDDKAIDDVNIFSEKMELSPDSLHLGFNAPGSTSYDSVKIFNNTLDSLQLTNITTPQEFQILNNQSSVLKPSDSIYLKFSFTPSDTGNYKGYANITSEVNSDSVFLFGSCKPTSVLEQEQNLKLSIYPNPVNETLNIDFKDIPASGDYLLKIVNMQGQIVYREMLNITEGKHIEKNVSHLSSGIYQIHLISNKMNYKYKFIRD